MGKKVLVIIIALLLLGGVIGLLYVQKVTIAVLSGQVSYTGSSVGLEISQIRYLPLLNLEVRNISRLNYMLMTHGRPEVTESHPVKLPNVVNITIKFKLITPTNTVLEFEPLKLGEGGSHNFQLIVGPNEGLTTTGTFYLIIEFYLKVTTPQGLTIVEIHKTIEIAFTVPKGSVSIIEK